MSTTSSRSNDVLTLRVGDAAVELLRVQPGSFIMGSTRGLPHERPPHCVSIEHPYYLAKYLVTQRLWELIMKGNPAQFANDPQLPVDSVSWDDANRFCGRLSVLSGEQVRLPTEAEWEYACRAGTETEWFFGDDQSVVGQYAWYDLNSQERTHAVGSKSPNPWGFFDMIGNVWEWCADVWHGDYLGAPSTGAAWLDGANIQPRRVLRGGAWDMDVFRCRSAYRSYDYRELSLSRIGLRIVVTSQTDGVA